MPQYAFFQGEIVPFEQANISVMTHAFNYGTGCFEGIRAYWNEAQEQAYVFKLEEHFERFIRNYRILRIELPYSVDELCDVALELLRRERYREDAYVRPLAYKSSLIVGVRLHDLEADFTCFVVPFGKYIEREEGAHVAVSSYRRISDNAIPARAKITGAYVNSAFSKSEAMLNGFDEAIVLTEDGHVSEGSAENLFIVRDGKLITPPVTDDILEGITRATVMELVREEMGLETIERSIDRGELYVADEAFFCGTGVQIVAIAQVDHRPVGPGRMGPVVSELREIYFGIVRGENPKYLHWCTPVFPKG
jgi:branched-chain amino acid aminotransferase